MSYNTLLVAAELGINRVVTASSVNSIGMGQFKAWAMARLFLDIPRAINP